MSVYTGGVILGRFVVHGNGSSLVLYHAMGGVTSVFPGGGVGRRVMPCSGSVVRFAGGGGGGSNGSTDVSSVSLFILIESSVELTSSMSVRGRSRRLIDHGSRGG